jgi:hypothetical protein
VRPRQRDDGHSVATPCLSTGETFTRGHAVKALRCKRMVGTTLDGAILTRSDPFWGRPCLAYNLQARFPGVAVALLRRMQDCFTKEVSVPLNVVPETALHLSLYSIIPFSWPDDAKEPFWQSTRERLLEIVPELAREWRRLSRSAAGRLTVSRVLGVSGFRGAAPRVSNAALVRGESSAPRAAPHSAVPTTG